MNDDLKSQIRDDLIRHEGVVLEVYLDSEGLKTIGIGHLVTKSDPEWTWPTGTEISEERAFTAFGDDLQSAIEDTEATIDDLYSHPDNVVRVLVNMMFNLGKTRFRKFKKMLHAIRECDYATAAEEMVDSKWYHQVGRRSKELVRLMEWSVYG